ncbi:MAG: DNA replication and repair protein RecF [Saprospiraceae bacterium]
MIFVIPFTFLIIQTIRLSTLILTNFKNYEYQSFKFTPGFNLIYGPNGSGKTNVLDAIHYLALVKSHFVPQDRMAIRSGNSFFRLEGIFNNDNKAYKVVLKYQHKNKKLEFDDQSITRIADHIGKVGLVMIAPDDLEIIDGLSALRRKYMDITLVQTNHTYLTNLTLYKKLLDQRNAYLKQVQPIDPLFLQVLNEKMESPANALFQFRLAFAKEFIPYFNKYYHAISGDKELVDIQYESDLEKDSFLHLLQGSLSQDLRTQYTNKGCHKDDLRFMINGLDVKFVASQGQKKTFLVSLFLAQADYMSHTMTSPPLILLDDVFDKLDPDRMKLLVRTLKTMDDTQIIMTDTNQDRIMSIIKDLQIDGNFIDIENPDFNGIK